MFEFLGTIVKSLRKRIRKSSEAGDPIANPAIECPSTKVSISPFDSCSSAKTHIIRLFERPRPLTAQHFYAYRTPSEDASADACAGARAMEASSYTPSKSHMVTVQDGPHERAAILPTRDFTRHVRQCLEAKRRFYCLLQRHVCTEKKSCRKLWGAWERYCRLRDIVDIGLEEVWIGCGLMGREPRPKVYTFEEELWEEDEKEEEEGEEGENEWTSDEEGVCGCAGERADGPPVLPELPFARERERDERPFIPIFPERGGIFDEARSACPVPRVLVISGELEKPKLHAASMARPASEIRKRITKSLRRTRKVHWDEQNLGNPPIEARSE